MAPEYDNNIKFWNICIQIKKLKFTGFADYDNKFWNTNINEQNYNLVL